MAYSLQWHTLGPARGGHLVRVEPYLIFFRRRLSTDAKARLGPSFGIFLLTPFSPVHFSRTIFRRV